MNDMAFPRCESNLLRTSSSALRQSSLAASASSAPLSADRQYAAVRLESAVPLPSRDLLRSSLMRSRSHDPAPSSLLQSSSRSMPSSASELSLPMITEISENFSSAPAPAIVSGSAALPSRMASTSWSSEYFLWKSM